MVRTGQTWVCLDGVRLGDCPTSLLRPYNHEGVRRFYFSITDHCQDNGLQVEQ